LLEPFPLVFHSPVCILGASFCLFWKLSGLGVSQQKCYYRVGWFSKYLIPFLNNAQACLLRHCRMPANNAEASGSGLFSRHLRNRAPSPSPPTYRGLLGMTVFSLKLWDRSNVHCKPENLSLSFLRGLELPALGREHRSVVSVS